jgi:putative membrane-bound dehydrogenase-like protein
MNRFSRATLLLFAFSFTLAPQAAQFKFPNHTFTVPDGFEVQLAANSPLVDRPIVADFDDQGRLYVADSSGSNDKVEKQLQDKPHRIVRLEDTDGDGKFDKTIVFADKMMFPEGAMWMDGSLYVSAPPSIWKLTDSDGDGVADQRVEWFQGKTLTGCANDLHGPYLGPDGWIYWCKGAFAKQTYERPGKPPFITRAAHIFRCRPDGSGLEPVMTGGMDNPVDVVFTPGGERIFTTTFFQQPGGGQRDGLIHAIYGGVYGKVNDVTDDHKKTGELMPVLTHLGAAAPCGLARYESWTFGREYQDNIFACNFNLHRVTRHVLEPKGASFVTHDSDFIASDNTDFHPTDVLEDADGSLLVIDTGGWYKLCCPTSQLSKPDVLGAIYRVRRTNAPKVNDPRGLKLAWATMTTDELVKLIGDNRPAICSRAIQQLAKEGNKPVPLLTALLQKPAQANKTDLTSAESTEIRSRRNAVWALIQIGTGEARGAARIALADDDESVCQAAIHGASVWRNRSALPQLIGLLKSQSAQLHRAAAEAIGRIGGKSAVPDLLMAAARVQNDRALEHSLTYALIEIADPTGTAGGLRAESSLTKRAALIALDQMDGGGLKAEMVTPLLISSDPVLKQTASWIVGHRPEWADALAGFFRDRLAEKNLSAGDRAELERQIAPLARGGAIQELLAATLRDASTLKESRLTVLRAMARTSLKETPAAWTAELTRALEGNDAEVIRQAVSAIRALPNPKNGVAELTSALMRVGRDGATPADVRLDALAAVPGPLVSLGPNLFEFLRASVDPAKPVLMRSAAAGALAKAKLEPVELLILTDTLKTTGPLELPKLLGAFEKSTDEALGLSLISALQHSTGVAGLRAETLKPRLTNFPMSVQLQGEQLLASLNVDAAKQKARLEDLLANCQGGDIRRGQAIFNSSKTACASCHAFGYLGGNLGPDLTRIGRIRTERDLLEAIVYPSGSFVRSYEPIMVVTKSGDQHNGVLRKDSAEEVVLGTGPGAEVRIARSDIIEMRPGTVSVMPGGLDEQLSRAELADLLAFLKASN